MAVEGNYMYRRGTRIILYDLFLRLFEMGNTIPNVITSLIEHTSTLRAVEVDTELDEFMVIANEREEGRSLLPHSITFVGHLQRNKQMARKFVPIDGAKAQILLKKLRGMKNTGEVDHQLL